MNAPPFDKICAPKDTNKLKVDKQAWKCLLTVNKQIKKGLKCLKSHLNNKSSFETLSPRLIKELCILILVSKNAKWGQL